MTPAERLKWIRQYRTDGDIVFLLDVLDALADATWAASDASRIIDQQNVRHSIPTQGDSFDGKHS